MRSLTKSASCVRWHRGCRPLHGPGSVLEWSCSLWGEAVTTGTTLAAPPLSPANCGGLIEAQLLAASENIGDYYFPPRTAGASLKRSQKHAGYRGIEKLSPANCGGLIEAWTRAPARGRRRGLSPANCGGLIEAELALTGQDEDATLSPANCGGLIEAARYVAKHPQTCILSPANCGGLIEATG